MAATTCKPYRRAVTLRVRLIGFRPKVITGVTLGGGEVATQDVALEAETVQLAELTVTAEAERGSVARALNEQRQALNVVNAVTAEEISRSPDGDAAAAVQRVSGVTVQDGKFVVVRGLGERYTTTSLNGTRIPSTEPDRKVAPLDLFPAGLLDGGVIASVGRRPYHRQPASHRGRDPPVP